MGLDPCMLATCADAVVCMLSRVAVYCHLHPFSGSKESCALRDTLGLIAVSKSQQVESHLSSTRRR